MSDNEILALAVKTLDEKKGEDIKVIKIADVSTIANYFILASGSSSTQVKTLADETEQRLKKEGVVPQRTEKYRGADWVVLDYIDVVIHIFFGKTRETYDLERLWEDGEQLDTSAFLK